MGWLDRHIERATIKGAKAFFQSDEFSKIAMSVLDADPRYCFEREMARHFIRTAPSMTNKIALDLARERLVEYLMDEGIKFGDPAYAWDRNGAIDIASEYETDHWEAA